MTAIIHNIVRQSRESVTSNSHRMDFAVKCSKITKNKFSSILAVSLLAMTLTPYTAESQANNLLKEKTMFGIRQCIPPTFETSFPSYNSARSIVLGHGFRPSEATPSDDCHKDSGQFDSLNCTDYPEIRACSGTGLGYCSMQFENQSDDILKITTAMGSPDPDNEEVHVVWAALTCPSYATVSVEFLDD